MELIKAQKGTQDILPGQSENWQVVEDVMRSEAALHGFGEIRTPVFEDTRLFQRSVGETTDVVQKEMYTFQDKGGRSITLRPEGTAGVVRALLEHALYNNGLPVKLHYFTTCYRYENTQAGRLREFHQFGVEMFGSNSPSADAEVIGLAKSVFDRLGIKNLRLEINSIGCPTCRAELRILDCKSPICSKIAEGAPKILDYLCDDCKAHFEAVQKYLTAVGTEFTVNPTIVRGLDYYTNTVFEFISGDLGAQSTLCGGGRYNGLVEEMGGQPMPGLGFAMGIERLMMVMDKQNIEMPAPDRCEIFIASLGEAAHLEAFKLADSLRKYSIIAACDENDRGLKAQMKYADKIGAKYSMVLGDDEIASQKAVLKNMKTGEKKTIDLSKDFVEQYVCLSTEQEDLAF